MANTLAISAIFLLFIIIIIMICVGRYRTFVSEDAGPNTLVATVLAKDPDGDGITYKITMGNEEGNFVIDSQKGRAAHSLLIR